MRRRFRDLPAQLGGCAVLPRRPLLLGLGMLFLLGCAGAAGREAPPNFVILLADDLGYGDLGSFGHPTIRTPNLDLLAREGMRFTQFYAAASLCTPSRAGLLTGRRPVRSGMMGARGVLYPDSSGGLPAAETTLAEALQARDYATALVGKWHLGHLPEFLPEQHGFDYFFGLPYSNDMRPENEHWDYARENFPPLPLLEGASAIERSPEQALLTRRFTAKAVEFIERHQEQPFFLLLSYSAPHTPLAVSAERAGTSKRGLYGDVVEELDWSVGAVVETLRRLDLSERTLVFFTSDNGPWNWRGLDGGSAGLLRGAKGSPWEGGFRVPAIAWMPGTVPANVTSSALASALDLFPTFAGMAGLQPAAHSGLDGFDLLPALTGAEATRDELLYYHLGNLRAYRQGAWKFFPQSPDSWPGEERESGRPLLFNIERDPSEKHNLADQHPERLARLAARLAEFRRMAPQTPSHLESILPEHQEAYARYRADL